MKSLFLILVAITCMMAPLESRADWVGLSAAANCDVNGGLFSLVPLAETSEAGLRIAAPRGFTEFMERENQSFNCKLGKTSIRLVFSRFGPSATGMGQGAGVLRVERFTVNGKDLLRPSTNFFWQVSSERTLTKVLVHVHGGTITTTYCYSDGFDWFEPGLISNLKCQDHPSTPET